MITPLAFSGAAAFRAGQDHKRLQIEDIIRARIAELQATPGPIPRRGIAELTVLLNLVRES